MDNETDAQSGAWYEDYLPEDAAPLEDAADDESPSDAAGPAAADQTDQVDDDSEEAVEEDPVEALRAEREAHQALQRQWNQRAEQDAQREQERTQRERQQADQQRITNRQAAWNGYQQEKQRISAARIGDARRAAAADDPALAAQHYAMLRDQEDRAADHKYYSWFAQDQAAERAQLVAERDRAAVHEYANYVRESYQLPYDELKRIMAYGDGTPVDPNAMSARAAEIVAQRNERATLKRQLTTQAREDGKADVRRRSQAAPARGRGSVKVEEIEGTLEELDTLFPRDRRRLRRVS